MAEGVPAAQFPPGSIHGVVVDSGGRPLPDVEVRLIDVSSAKSITAHTDIAGEFSFAGLLPGNYSLSLELESYAVQRIGPYEVLPESPVEILARLEELAAPLTRPAAGLEGIALEYGLVREQIESVPVMLGTEGRTAVDKLLLLVPGMTPVEALEVDPFSGHGSAVSANGSRRSAINYLLDGGSNNAQNRLTGAQAATFAPPLEGVDTFRVVTHTYSARDGRNAGAVVAPVTRAGGANWHGQMRAFWRPHLGSELVSYDASSGSLEGLAGGGQVGGPLSQRLFFLLDAELWRTERRHTGLYPVLSLLERNGDFSADPASAPIDPGTGQPFADALVPTARFDHLMLKYLDTFVPLPNVGERLHRDQIILDSGGEMALGRLDYRLRRWAIHASHVAFRNEVRDPLSETRATSPFTVARRRQLSHSAQISFVHTPTPGVTHTIQASGQRLSIGSWNGHLDLHDTSAGAFGFEYAEINGVDPGMIPAATLLTNTGVERFRIAPFLSSEASIETTYQIRNDFEFRRGGQAFRVGTLLRRGMWPFTNTENFAGTFDFTAEAFQGTRNSAANLLMGIPGRFRLQTPRSLDLRWREFAFYGEGDLRPTRGLQITLGMRFESQPPAVDRFDRIAAFRAGTSSGKFTNSLPNLIFPGDPDPDSGGVLPRSTIRTDGRNWAPRVGLAFSPTSENVLSRWILGESNRSVIRASYGVFHDFGTFAGSSATALFRATYPPWSTDNRFDFSRLAARGNFRAPLSPLPPLSPGQIVSNQVSYPIVVFDPTFDNARAHHWTIGWQRLLPGRVFASAVYLGTRSLRLQRQRELNTFERNPVLSFAFIENMRRFSQFREVRSFESSGNGRFQGVQLRANRYLSRGLAFDFSYNWSRSEDNGSSDFGDELVTASWSPSNFDRTHTVTASWFYQWRMPRRWAGKLGWLDNWQISGIWRWRSGLPLDIRQAKDPTFSFQRIGRPDLIGPFRQLDPSETQAFTLADGRTITGRFAFDPTVFKSVVPASFNELRTGTVTRNQFRMHGFQQWDLRVGKRLAVGESASLDFGADMINAFGNRNWDSPFANINDPSFGIVRGEGINRVFQISLRLLF